MSFNKFSKRVQRRGLPGRGKDTEGQEPPKVWRLMRATESRPMTEDRSVRDWVQQVRPQLQDQGDEGFVSEKKDN